jgi:hypothetical protein
MDTIGGLQGFVELKIVNRTTGEIKQHIRQTNTLTRGAIASIFARGMFEKSSCYRCESPMANVNRGNANDVSWKPAQDAYAWYQYLYGNTWQWTHPSAQYSQRDSRGLNNGLAGINHNDGDYSIFSAFAPNTFGVYLLRNEVRVDKYTQVPPYAGDKCAVLSSDIAGYSDGVVMENSGEAELAQQMYGSPAGSFFNPAHLIFARQLIRHEGVFMIKAIVWGAKVDDACCWGVRARIKGFDNAGYSHFYAIEHRIVNNEPQTILWQDGSLYFNNTNLSRDITGYNVTTGQILNEKVSLTSKPSHWMGAFMQGVVIGNSAFSVSASGSSVVVNRYSGWKSGDNTVSATVTISPTRTATAGTALSGVNPVAVHNLATGKLEVFITLTKLAETYEVCRISIDPVTLTYTQTPHFLPYLVTQTLPSVSGTNTALAYKNDSGQTRSSTFVGFLDYTSKTNDIDGIYHLPFSKFIVSGKEVTVNDFPTAWMYGYRVGVRFGIDKASGEVILGSEFIVCGLYSFSSPSYDLSSSAEEYAFYARDENYRTCNHDRVLQWCYTKTAFQNTVLPVQMLPTAGPFRYAETDSNNWASGRNPFSLMTVSRVLCGLNLESSIFKGEDDTLFVTYGWQLKIFDT